MSQEEVYKKLESQIRSNIDYLKENDPFFHACMEGIYEIVKCAPLPKQNQWFQGPLSFSSTEKNMMLAAEFLSLCKEEYGKRFLSDYQNKNIKVVSNSKSRCEENRVEKTYQVIINKNNTLKEALDMVHEYFHVLNLEITKIPYIRQSFTETISLTSELLFLDFLKEKGISEYDIQLLKEYRIELYRNNILAVQYLLPLYKEVKEQSKLDLNFYEKQEAYYKTMNMDKRSFLTCGYQISQYENSLTDISCYKYIIGYAYASYFHQHSGKKSDLVVANESLKIGDIATALTALTSENIELEELSGSINQELIPFTYKKTKTNKTSIP